MMIVMIARIHMGDAMIMPYLLPPRWLLICGTMKCSELNQPMKGATKMRIERNRFCVMRRNRTEIWGGLAQHYRFRPIEEMGNFAIKTYRSEKQALSGCSSWDRDFEVVPITEVIVVAKRPKEVSDNGMERWVCDCGNLMYKKQKYCDNCGQKFDWEG
jgi:hypothetical protein